MAVVAVAVVVVVVVVVVALKLLEEDVGGELRDGACSTRCQRIRCFDLLLSC